MNKPYPDYPLTLHSTGQWCKKIRGKRFYFGSDWKKALKKYEQFLRKPTQVGEPIVADLVEAFMSLKEAMRDSGEIKADTFNEYQRTCNRLISVLGKYTPLANLQPQHFERLRAELSGSMGLVTLKGQLTRLRSIFAYAYEAGLVTQPLRFKTSLRAPAARILRQAKKDRSLRTDEVKSLIKHSSGFMAPAILLGINCGLGNTDVCELMWSHIDGRWLTFPRPKTGVNRRSYLWKETVEALKKWKKAGPTSLYVCCGRQGQKLGAGISNSTPIAHLFEAIAEAAEVKAGFYSLRHTYRTLADGAGDEPAVYLTMGHADPSIGAVYRHRIDDSRLIAISEFVHNQLFGVS